MMLTSVSLDELHSEAVSIKVDEDCRRLGQLTECAGGKNNETRNAMKPPINKSKDANKTTTTKDRQSAERDCAVLLCQRSAL